MIAEVNGLTLEVRGPAGAPPVLIVGPGPGFPLLHEAARVERTLGLEAWQSAFLEQRGCGRSRRGAEAPSVAQSIADVASAATWLATRAGTPVVAIGMSLGASYAIAAAARDPAPFRAIVGLGLDVDLAAADAAAHAFVVSQAEARGDRRALSAAAEFAPPVTTSRAFQERAKWLTEFGGMQPGARWAAMVRRTFVDLVRGYGLLGTLQALRAMTRVQNGLLPELASFRLHEVRRLELPIALVHGARDAVSPSDLVQRWIDGLSAPSKSLRVVEGIGHLPHVEAPEIVRAALAEVAPPPRSARWPRADYSDTAAASPPS